MYQMFEASTNPQAFIQSMMANNPKAVEITQLINAHGGDAKSAFYTLAKQKGIDPDEFLKSLR